MKNLSKIAAIFTIGLVLTVQADKVHAQTVDQMKVCKAISVVSSAAHDELFDHYKAKLSLNGVSGSVQDEFVPIAETLYNNDLNTFLSILNNCIMGKGTSSRVGGKVRRN